MTFKEAYGAAFKAALGIIGFYIVSGGVILLGLWTFATENQVAGAALAAFGVVMAWLSAFAVIIKVSVDEVLRRSARRIDGGMARIMRLVGQNENPDPSAHASGGEMNWGEAFGAAFKVTIGIILLNIAGGILMGMGVALIAIAVSFGDIDIVGIFAIAAGLATLVFGGMMAILGPFGVMIARSVEEATKRSDLRTDCETKRMTTLVDEWEADTERSENENRVSAPPMPAGERPESFSEAARAADPPISERLSPFAEAARRRAAAQTDPNENPNNPTP